MTKMLRMIVKMERNILGFQQGHRLSSQARRTVIQMKMMMKKTKKKEKTKLLVWKMFLKCVMTRVRQ
jgi:hypothetical protein